LEAEIFTNHEEFNGDQQKLFRIWWESQLSILHHLKTFDEKKMKA
jgi:hypothetical protein